MHTTATENVVSYISSQYSVEDYLSLVEKKRRENVDQDGDTLYNTL
jgi:hypothetical protein